MRWKKAGETLLLDDYLGLDMSEEQLKELRFAPKTEAVRLFDPSGKPYTGFRAKAKNWATVFTLFPGDLVLLVAEYKHGGDSVTFQYAFRRTQRERPRI